MRSHPTVCVAGGGPAGLAAAIALRNIGCAATVVDCSTPPIDKACGEGLLPESIVALAELGVDIPPDIGFAFRGIRFVDSRSSVCADFRAGVARGVRRTALHRLLLDRAKEIGVQMIWNAKHVRLSPEGLSLDGRALDADLVVGADGQNSLIRRQARLHTVRREKRRYAFRRHYRVTPWSDYVELHWGVKAQVYVTPIGADQVCLAAISRHSRCRLDDALAEIPELIQRVQGVEPVSLEAGGLSVSRTLKAVYRDRVVLLGDASGSVDAITGEGMSLAFRQALALAEAVRANDLAQYSRAHSRIMRRPQTMASLLLMLERSPRLNSRVLTRMARRPEIFELLLAIHVGGAKLRELCSPTLLGFGRDQPSLASSLR